jgi:hypothetical protein
MALVCDNQSTGCDKWHKSVTNRELLLPEILVYNIF